MFRSLLNIASYLCATLYVPSPAVLLEPYHARGAAQDTLGNLTWAELLLFQVSTPNSAGAPNQLFVEYDDTKPESLEQLWQASVTIDKTNRKQIGGKTTRPRRVPNDFAAAEAQSWKKNEKYSFTWDLKASYWSFDTALATQLEEKEKTLVADNQTHRARTLPTIRGKYDACTYSSLHPPAPMQTIIDRVWDRIRMHTQNASVVGYLHIRRGDVAHKCDTSPMRMKKFFKCSFGNMKNSNATALALSTDERDPKYRAEIGGLISKYAYFVDLDQTVETIIREDIEAGRVPPHYMNNYYIFQTVRWVAQRTSYQVLQRLKSYCKDCTDLSTLPQWKKRFQL
jgi:hypothetical protein